MFTGAIEAHFTGWDWAVLVGYLLLTTWVGHKMSGQQASIKDFFLGGRTLPWWAVSGSMIATEISALTFIGVPGIVFGLMGDWTYLQWGVGSMVARFAVAYWLIPLYYEKEIYSPYDFMGNRLGAKVKTLVTGLFSLGSILGQSVRVLVTAIILREVTGLSVEFCIVVIGLVAVIWTLMGGMQTVIWTDVMQFCLFVFGGLLALFLLLKGLGWSEVVALNQVVVDGVAIDKMRFLDLTAPFEKPELRYTLWVGLLAMPFQNFTAFGVDQLNTQRMFCCGSVSDARKAMCWSSVSLLITLLMLAVGSGLFAWYQQYPPEAALAAKFAESPNNVFPAWIVREVPVGLSGLILAGAFAAAISSLDSILAALSQTSLSVIYGQERMEEEGQGARMVKISRIAVLIWGVILTLAGLLLWEIYRRNDDSDLIGLAFGMVAYTYGPLLGVLLAALIPWRVSGRGLVVGTTLSVLLVAYFRPELMSILEMIGQKDLAKALIESRPKLASEWFFPINALITLACGLGGGFFKRE
ncbi:MAG: hypothetical protein IZT59_07645 [Verrucomicrobia bacterium]|nr:hypothetical protein [Verrucomicrobiota bacterium]|tara:strand:- start:14720 stop:16294 length:1575 start_codon:yes stop_codon:yes gene_type:complete